MVFRGFTFDIFDPALLSFSLGIAAVMIIFQFLQLKKYESNYFVVVFFYICFILLFLSIFVYITILRSLNNQYVTKIISLLTNSPLSTQIGQLGDLNNLIALRSENLSGLNFIWIIPIYIAVPFIGYSIFVKWKFDIGDE